MLPMKNLLLQVREREPDSLFLQQLRGSQVGKAKKIGINLTPPPPLPRFHQYNVEGGQWPTLKAVQIMQNIVQTGSCCATLVDRTVEVFSDW